MSFSIKPIEFMREIGWRPAKRGNWLVLKKCPFCDGGRSEDAFTFAVHETDGNYFCHRSKCGVKGSFWKLIESVGRNPKDYWNKDKKKRFIYK